MILKISSASCQIKGLIVPITGRLLRLRATLPTRGMSTSTMAMTIGTLRLMTIMFVVYASPDNV